MLTIVGTQAGNTRRTRNSLMRAVTITKPGGPEVLEVTDRQVRAAGPVEVRITVKSAAVNPTDIAMRSNEQYAKGTAGIPGMDAAGIVESLGEGVDRLKVGDEVMAVVTPRRP
jgi:NADPH:quinone reductase-like Zn-dependent oxidoreductase